MQDYTKCEDTMYTKRDYKLVLDLLKSRRDWGSNPDNIPNSAKSESYCLALDHVVMDFARVFASGNPNFSITKYLDYYNKQ